VAMIRSYRRNTDIDWFSAYVIWSWVKFRIQSCHDTWLFSLFLFNVNVNFDEILLRIFNYWTICHYQ